MNNDNIHPCVQYIDILRNVDKYIQVEISKRHCGEWQAAKYRDTIYLNILRYLRLFSKTLFNPDIFTWRNKRDMGAVLAWLESTTIKKDIIASEYGKVVIPQAKSCDNRWDHPLKQAICTSMCKLITNTALHALYAPRNPILDISQHVSALLSIIHEVQQLTYGHAHDAIVHSYTMVDANDIDCIFSTFSKACYLPHRDIPRTRFMAIHQILFNRSTHRRNINE